MKTSPATSLELVTQAELAQGGEAVARAPDGRVVFIEGAAPGETVLAEIVESKKSFQRARTLQVIHASADRRTPDCPHFEQCGGCSLQHVAPEAQRRSKVVALVESLRRLGRIDPGSYQLEEAWAGPAYGYRTRARLAVGQGAALGYRKGQSHRVIKISACPILEPHLDKARKALQQLLEERPPKIRDLVEVTLVGNGQRAIVSLPRALAGYAEGLMLHGVEVADRAPPLHADDGEGSLTLVPEVFAQANHGGNRALVQTLKAWAGPGPFKILELYSGSGNFTRALLPLAERILALESDPRAAGLAKRALRGPIEVRGKPVEAELERLLAGEERFDLVVLDPPRTGLSIQARAALAQFPAPRMLYVSCDPPTFARDVGALAEGGWKLTQLQPFDLYPQTGHLEVLGALSKTL